MKKIRTLISGRPVVQSTIWVGMGQIGGQFLRLVSNLVLTRLLVPEMFGVMTVANTVIVGLYMCSYVGIQHNVIQSPRGDEKNFLDTAWTVQVIRGVVLTVLALSIALALYMSKQAGIVPEGSVYADQSLPYILAVLSILPLISGFESMKLATASRHMQVGKLTIIDLATQLIGIIIMATLAYTYKSVWVLVAGVIVSSFAKLIVSYVALPGGRNYFHWDVGIVKDLIGFGKWILLATLLGFFVRSSDKLILGALVSPTILGLYSIAIFMSQAIADVFAKWTASVVLPVLSRRHREGPEELSNAYYKYSFYFTFGTLFLCGILFNVGYIVIEVLYDTRYVAAGAMIQILSLSLLGLRTNIASQCFIAMGKPKMDVPMNVLQLFVLFAFLVPAYNYFGLNGALYVVSISVISTLPITWYLLKRVGILNWKKELITLPAFFLGYAFSTLIVMVYEAIKVAYNG